MLSHGIMPKGRSAPARSKQRHSTSTHHLSHTRVAVRRHGGAGSSTKVLMADTSRPERFLGPQAQAETGGAFVLDCVLLIDDVTESRRQRLDRARLTADERVYDAALVPFLADLARSDPHVAPQGSPPDGLPQSGRALPRRWRKVAVPRSPSPDGAGCCARRSPVPALDEHPRCRRACRPDLPGRVDVPQRFAKSKSVGAHFGLTPRRFSSGEIDDTAVSASAAMRW